MNNNHDKVGSVSNTEEKIQQQQQPRIIQIPVQHINTTNSPRGDSPLRNQHSNQKQHQDHKFGTFPNSIFNDKFASHFGQHDSPLNRHFANRDRETDPRFPLLSSRYEIPDSDDFFNSNKNDFFNSLPSHPRELNHLHQDKEPQSSSTATNTNTTKPPQVDNSNNYFQSSPIPVLRTDSPQRFVSHTTVQPNQHQQQQPLHQQQQQQANSISAGIPIKIQHISTLPHKSDFTNIKLDTLGNQEPKQNQHIPSSPTSNDSSVKSKTSPPKTILKTESPTNMGNLSGGGNKKLPSDFAHPIKKEPTTSTTSEQEPTERPPPPHQASPQPQPSLPKTAQDKCEEVLQELNVLEKEVETFNGIRNDKQFLKIDEYLTRCLLKLDEMERSDENLNQIRKRLIKFTTFLTDKLEAKVSENERNEAKANEETTDLNKDEQISKKEQT